MTSQQESKDSSRVRIGKRPPPPIPPSRRLHTGAQGSSSPSSSRQTAVVSIYRMNDIERGTTYAQVINSLQVPPHMAVSGARVQKSQPHVQCSLVMGNSRLDDELSVACITFSDTPQWLQDLEHDSNGFPKKTKFGTLWSMQGVNTTDVDANGQTEFIRAVIKGTDRANLFYPEMLAEFDDIDVNIQDSQGRTALHWACVQDLEDMVRLCLSVPGFDIGRKDNDGFTAFDISLRKGKEAIPALFYGAIFADSERDPDEALLRVLTLTSEPAQADKPVFPGVAIFDPIEKRNRPLVTALLNRGVDLTATNLDGDTALHVAAALEDNADVATQLLEAGAAINAIGNAGATPLHYAARSADEDMVRALLHWNADIDVEDVDKKTALQRAEGSRHLGIAGLIKAHAGAGDPNHPAQSVPEEPLADLMQVSPVVPAAHEDLQRLKQRELIRRQMVEKLADAGLSGKDGEAELLEAVSRGDLDTTRVLLGLGVDKDTFNEGNGTMLQHAVRGGHQDIVKALLAAGYKINGKDRPYLSGQQHFFHFIDTRIGESNVVTAIYEPADWEHHSALLTAASTGNNDMAKILLAAGANVNVARGETTALLLASYFGHSDIVQTLLTAGANIEYEFLGYTALLVAARARQVLIVQALLTAGANVEHQNDTFTALLLAAQCGSEPIIDALLTAGADIEHAVGEYTPLLMATISEQNGAVHRLLAARANIEAEHNGRTALFLAAYTGNAQIVQTLVTAGANVNCHSWGKTALQVASKAGEIEIVKILREAGALTTTSRIMKGARRQLWLQK